MLYYYIRFIFAFCRWCRHTPWLIRHTLIDFFHISPFFFRHAALRAPFHDAMLMLMMMADDAFAYFLWLPLLIWFSLSLARRHYFRYWCFMIFSSSYAFRLFRFRFDYAFRYYAMLMLIIFFRRWFRHFLLSLSLIDFFIFAITLMPPWCRHFLLTLMPLIFSPLRWCFIAAAFDAIIDFRLRFWCWWRDADDFILFRWFFFSLLSRASFLLIILIRPLRVWCHYWWCWYLLFYCWIDADDTPFIFFAADAAFAIFADFRCIFHAFSFYWYFIFRLMMLRRWCQMLIAITPLLLPFICWLMMLSCWYCWFRFRAFPLIA